MDALLVFTVAVVLFSGYRLSYVWGRDRERERWERRMDWYRDVIARESRPAARHAKEGATERTFPYKGEVQ